MTAVVNQKMTALKSFRESLDYIRRERDLSWAEIARISELNRQYLRDIMNGKRNPKAQTQAKIALSLGFELTEFLSLCKSFTQVIKAQDSTDDTKVELLQQIANLSQHLTKKDDEIEALKSEISRLKSVRPKAARQKAKAADFPISAVPAVPGGELEKE